MRPSPDDLGVFHVLVRWQFWFATVVALAVAVLAGYDMMLFAQNRATQAELARRNLYVQQSAQLDTLYREMVRALAELAARDHDSALTALLTEQGIPVGSEGVVPATRTAPSVKQKP